MGIKAHKSPLRMLLLRMSERSDSPCRTCGGTRRDQVAVKGQPEAFG
jgi:hypothetical protein